jgi:hypothetical protein
MATMCPEFCWPASQERTRRSSLAIDSPPWGAASALASHSKTPSGSVVCTSSNDFPPPFRGLNGSLLAALVFALLTVTFTSLLPAIDEVPSDFPASVLWRFRIASWEMQCLLWSTLGLLFGWLTERERSGRTLVR